jgi:hypothetical protein
LRGIESVRPPAAGRRSRLYRLRRSDRRHGRRSRRHPRSAPAPHFVERSFELVVSVLKLLDVAGQLADLILQALDPVQKVRRIGLGVRGRRDGQAIQQEAAQQEATQ